MMVTLLKTAFSALTREEREQLRAHLDAGTPVLCGIDGDQYVKDGVGCPATLACIPVDRAPARLRFRERCLRHGNQPLPREWTLVFLRMERAVEMATRGMETFRSILRRVTRPMIVEALREEE